VTPLFSLTTPGGGGSSDVFFSSSESEHEMLKLAMSHGIKMNWNARFVIDIPSKVVFRTSNPDLRQVTMRMVLEHPKIRSSLGCDGF
jgi:hypothetical protein